MHHLKRFYFCFNVLHDGHTNEVNRHNHNGWFLRLKSNLKFVAFPFRSLKHQYLINPITELRYSRVNPWLIWLSTSDTWKDVFQSESCVIFRSCSSLPQEIIPASWNLLSVRWITIGPENWVFSMSLKTRKFIYSVLPPESPSHESLEPCLCPAQMKICGICSIYPAFRYIDSQMSFLMTGTVTSWRTDGSGPSSKINYSWRFRVLLISISLPS